MVGAKNSDRSSDESLNQAKTPDSSMSRTATADQGEDHFPDPEAYTGSPQDILQEQQGEAHLRRLSRVATDRAIEERARQQESEQAEILSDSEKFSTLAWGQLRPSFFLDHLDYDSFRTCFRTWLVGAAAVVLICVHRTEVEMGNAAYLLLIYSAMLTPGGSTMIAGTLMVFLVLTATLTGWASAAIAHAIAWKIRGCPTKTQVLTDLISQGICENNPNTLAKCFSGVMFSGHYLRAKTTIIYIVFFVLTYMLFGSIKRLSPLNIIAFITGAISIVVNMAFDSLLPYYDMKLIGMIVFKPVSVVLAMMLVSCFLIFPVTANYKYNDGALNVLKMIEGIVQLEANLLRDIRHTSSPEDFEKYKKIGEVRKKALQVLSLLDLHAAMVRMEFSYGRFDIGDVGELRSIIKRLANTTMGFDLFYKNLQESRQLHEEASTVSQTGKPQRRASSFVDTRGTSKLYMMLHESYKPVGAFEQGEKKRQLKHFMKLSNPDTLLTDSEVDEVLGIVDGIFRDITQIYCEALTILVSWLAAANQFRIYSWVRRGKYKNIQEKEAEKLAAIRQSLSTAFIEVQERKKNAYQKVSHEKPRLLLNLISQSSLYGFLVDESTTSLLRILDLFISLDNERPKPKMIWPYSKSRHLKSSATMRTTHEVTDVDQESGRELPKFEPRKRTQARDPDASPPRKLIHLFGVKLVSFVTDLDKYQLFTHFKFALAGVVTLLPMFCKPTAHWYYSNRLIWVTIMTVFSASDIAAETFYSFLSKLVYTFLACIIGMVGWYISRGNPIGVGAVLMVIYAWVAYYRHFSLHRTPVSAIIFTLTSVLVVGTSWVDTSLPVANDIGAGFRVAWMRLVAVIVGLSVGLFPAILPRPKTGKAAIRKLIGRSVVEFGNLHCDVGKFAIQRGQNSELRIKNRSDLLENRMRLVLGKLAATGPLMSALKYEPPLTGVWPRSKYVRLLDLQTEIVVLYYLLYHVFDQLDDPGTWVTRMCERFGWTNSRLSADFFSMIYMISVALESKKPLPSVTHSHMALQHLNILKARSGMMNDASELQDEPSDIDGDSDNVLEEVNNSIDAFVPLDMKHIDTDVLFSNDGQLSTVGLILVHMIYLRVDEAMITVKRLVGEEFDVDAVMFYPDFDDIEKQSLLQGYAGKEQ